MVRLQRLEHAKILRTSARITAGFPTPLPMTATQAKMFRKPTATQEGQRRIPAAASRNGSQDSLLASVFVMGPNKKRGFLTAGLSNKEDEKTNSKASPFGSIPPWSCYPCSVAADARATVCWPCSRTWQ